MILSINDCCREYMEPTNAEANFNIIDPVIEPLTSNNARGAFWMCFAADPGSEIIDAETDPDKERQRLACEANEKRMSVKIINHLRDRANKRR